MNIINSFSNIQKEQNMDIDELFEIKSYNSNDQNLLQKENQKKISKSFSNISIVSNLDKDEVSELKSYNYNCKYTNKPLPSIFAKNKDEYDNNLSDGDVVFNDTNGISQDKTKLENINEIENKNIKEIYCVEIVNKIDRTSTSLDNIQENTKKQNCDNNINTNNSISNEENNNIFIYE